MHYKLAETLEISIGPTFWWRPGCDQNRQRRVPLVDKQGDFEARLSTPKLVIANEESQGVRIGNVNRCFRTIRDEQSEFMSEDCLEQHGRRRIVFEEQYRFRPSIFSHDDNNRSFRMPLQKGVRRWIGHANICADYVRGADSPGVGSDRRRPSLISSCSSALCVLFPLASS